VVLKFIIKIFLVDDDALFLKSLEIDFLENGDFIIEHIPPACFIWPIYQNEKHSTIYQ